MPQCKPKFCKTKRGQGKHTYAIPDPKKNKELCSKWIHNLGITNLDIRTFSYSPENIVCEEHFEEDCFEENMQAKLMGYTPKYKRLKPDAVPTIFKDTPVPKTRQTSVTRKRKIENKETIDSLLNYDADNNDVCQELPGGSGISTKSDSSSGNRRQQKKTKTRVTTIEQEKVDKGIQVSPAMCSVSVDCSIQHDKQSQLNCSNCYIRDNIDLFNHDHSYQTKNDSAQSNSTKTFTPCKSKDKTSVKDVSKENFASPEKTSTGIYLSDIEESPLKSDDNADDPSFYLSDYLLIQKNLILTTTMITFQINQSKIQS